MEADGVVDDGDEDSLVAAAIMLDRLRRASKARSSSDLIDCWVVDWDDGGGGFGGV